MNMKIKGNSKLSLRNIYEKLLNYLVAFDIKESFVNEFFIIKSNVSDYYHQNKMTHRTFSNVLSLILLLLLLRIPYHAPPQHDDYDNILWLLSKDCSLTVSH